MRQDGRTAICADFIKLVSAILVFTKTAVQCTQSKHKAAGNAFY